MVFSDISQNSVIYRWLSAIQLHKELISSCKKSVVTGIHNELCHFNIIGVQGEFTVTGCSVTPSI